MAPRTIRLLVAPFHLGRRGEDVGNGPLTLLGLGARAALGRGGAAVRVEHVAFTASDGDGELAALIGSVASVARQLASSMQPGELPVVLAGNCVTSVGVLAGLGDPQPAVVWLDAHGDFNTPETSVSGFLDGMALAAAVGDCWQGSLAAIPGFRPVPTDRVLLAGTRDLDPAEQERLAASPIRQLPADRLTEGPLPTPDGHPVHLHLDLDVLHDSLGPVNSYGLTSGGVPRATLLELVEAVSHRAGLRSVAITAYDPSIDSGDVASTALDVLEILGRDQKAPPR